ncbi:pericentriolar material 1 protein isoform X4 [Latimeria chalumnae]|uniref:pericentriolar material 1 protein isoform X4 n=1 Tax=Latimeria chalumnae TaxID=7897 RepID=UPI0006D8F9BB|nr:PREDICTED: pericentriolar material 1 protein isoform X4 [Latimeria chalumnae]|eukprot:XP_014350317.1 PREDICTED: pericentriolar material 1 protein isoform X4 [Latimeria chalumnae]
MATGGCPFDEGGNEQDLPNWSISNGSLDDRLNNMDWGSQHKKANRSAEKNKKKFSAGSEARLTNDISPESSPGVGRRKTKTPHTFPHTRYVSQLSVPEQAELERLKQRINFSDLDERSIGSDSQGRATAANNQRQLGETRKPFNFLPLQINTNKSKDSVANPRSKETTQSSQSKDSFAPVLSKDSLQSDQVCHDENGRGEPTIDSSQVVSRLVQIRAYITKASSMRDDLMEKNERSANVDRLSQLIEHLKEQEKSYMKFLQKILARENQEDDVRTIDSAVGSGSVAESTSLNIDVQSEASDATEVSHSLRIRPRIEDNLGNSTSQGQVSDFDVTTSPKGKKDRASLNSREVWPCTVVCQELGLPSKAGEAGDPQQNAKEELENLKKQHDLLKRMLQQQEQLRALQGRQAALLALQNKAEQAIAIMDDSVVTETTGSISGLSITSELNEELNDLIQRFHNQLCDSQTLAVPDNRRQAESLSLSREVSRSRNSSTSDQLSEEKAQLVNKLKVLQEKKQKMDKILDELHTLRDQHLNNNSFVAASGSPQRSVDQRSAAVAAAVPSVGTLTVNREPRSLASSACCLDSTTSRNDSEEEDNLNPREKSRKLKEVHKRLNELRELVHYYEQTSDMMTDAVNENTKDDDDDDEDNTEEESVYESEQENLQPIANIRNSQRSGNWADVNSTTNQHRGTNNQGRGLLNTECEINNRTAANLRSLNLPSVLDCRFNREGENEEENDREVDEGKDDDDEEEEEIQEERASEGTGSSRRSSLADEPSADPEFQRKIKRLIAAKQKLRQLQELVAVVQDDDEPGGAAAATNTSNLADLSLVVEESEEQQPNNIRASVPKTQKEISLNEKTREKFYEAKLQQQQHELKQLQEERKRLIEIQEKIQELQKACPDLQLSTSSMENSSAARKPPAATSTPAVAELSTVAKPIPDPANAPGVDNELWCEMRRHQILREELRQRRKQLEALMAEHQRRKNLTETTSAVAASINSDGSGTQQNSRTERTMATWGGSTQYALDEEYGDADEEDYPSDGILQAEEEEEDEPETSSHENYSMYPNQSRSRKGYSTRETSTRWRNRRAYSVDGNYRHSTKAKQQNVSTRRQENLRWASDLSHVEEKEQWNEQINQLKKQLEFSTGMCQTLMQDQQTLSYLLQTLLTGPYGVLPSNVGSPQVHFIMHQLNQCYTQLAWQQNNVQRLKQMLNDLLHQQNRNWSQNERDSTVPPPSPNMFCPFGFAPPSVNPFNVPGFANYTPATPGFNFNSVFPSGFGDFAQNAATQSAQQQSDRNTSGKMEYTAFPKPFESSSPNVIGTSWNPNPTENQAEPNRPAWTNEDQEGEAEELLQTGMSVPVQKVKLGGINQENCENRSQQFDEESLESLSSLPDPVDPTTVTKTFKSRKASAQASLASKDKTPKSKSKKRRNLGHHKTKGVNTGFESPCVSSASEFSKERSYHSKTEELVKANVFNKLTEEELERKLKCKKSPDLSSARTRRVLHQSNRNACTEGPETGSDFSLFESLRDTIYSEVATLISQNESRPHFLIELFHELQLLNTDYLRQRALYALQDIATRHISEKKLKEGDCTVSMSSAAWAASNSELTPSESAATFDDEISEKNYDLQNRTGSDQNDADNVSTMSTSSNLEPFANDDLGNTVIHLDKALARMREYERMKHEAECSQLSESCCGAIQGDLAAQGAGENSRGPQQIGGDSEIPCPRIDTQQLDKQIKAIMTEVIPFLKEHMEDVCSPQLLTSIRRMVLTLTQENDESKEFVRFFHKQLGGILQDSLTKFAGRKLKDCGEDLLVEISEILFNELAFFRLMQDLDNSSVAVKERCKRKIEAAALKQTYEKEDKKQCEDLSSSLGYLEDEDKDKDETETIPTTASFPEKSVEVRNVVSYDASDKEEDEDEELPVSISLSKAETQALTNYGSGEDENEDEEIEEFEAGPVDVQTSLQASNEVTDENEQEQVLSNPQDITSECKIHDSEQEPATSNEGENELPAVVPQGSFHKEGELTEIDDASGIPAEDVKPSLPLNEEGDLGTSTIAEGEVKSSTGTPESSMTGSPDTESPVLEAGSGNLSQKSDEDDFVKVDDLPQRLSALCEEELMKRMADEEQRNCLSDEILNTNGMQSQDLVGDCGTLKEPETVGPQSA